MNLQTKTFLILSLALLCSISIYIWIYAQNDHQRLMANLEQRSEQREFAFKAEQNSSEMRMLQIATFVAHDQKVQQLFLLGKHAVALEGGGAGGELTAQVRNSLYNLLKKSRASLAKQFDFRQLHFHLGPGSLSFLRVHRPEKFGDRMDDVRYTVVAVNAEQKNTMGFETGKSASGIRGVTPVYAFDGSSKKTVYVGALEAGTSFATMLSIFHQNSPWINVAVLLNQKHLQTNMFPDFFAKLSKEKQFIDGFFVEATTSSVIKSFLKLKDFITNITSHKHNILRDGEAHYSLTSFSLRDFQGEKDPTRADAGRVIMWEDVSPKFASYYSNIHNMIIYGILLFLLIELLLFYGLKLMTKGLQVELEQTREMEIASENAREIAEESSRLKTEFLNNMSHELRTPMNVIVGLGHMLNKGSLEPQQQQQFVTNINHSAQKLLNLIDEILLITKLDTNIGQKQPPENFNPLQLIIKVKQRLIEAAKDRSVNINIDCAKQLPNNISGYPDQLEQVLRQLLGNALKFGEGNDVTLSLHEHKRDDTNIILEFAVIDQGIGLSKEQLQTIFQPFQQGDSSKTRKYGGTGLGLTIVEKLLRQFNSSIEIESTLNQGSRFSFKLKLDLDPAIAANTSSLLSNPIEAEVEIKLPEGTVTEINQLLQQLAIPLERLQPKPCQEIARLFKKKQWPTNVDADIDTLQRLINQYRFAEAQEVVARLQKLTL